MQRLATDWSRDDIEAFLLRLRRFIQQRRPVAIDAEWVESKHPRGQPGNAGQFGAGGGSKTKIVSPQKHEGHSEVAQKEFGKEWSDVPTEDPATKLFDEHSDREVVEDPKGTAEKLIASYPPAVRKLIADTDTKVRRLLAEGQETEKLYRDTDGKWTPARQRVHLDIMSKILTPEAIDAARPANGQKPKFVVLGGRGGSGKAWFTTKQGVGADCLKLDSDTIKSMLPEYEGWNAALVHEESSYIFDRVTDIAKTMGLNICHDGTMRATEKSVAVIKRFIDDGYVPEAHYMFCAPQEAARRAVKRFVSGMEKNGKGRYVPPAYTMGSTTNEQTFDKVKDLCKAWSLYDNNVWGREPRHVANGGRTKSWPSAQAAA